MRLHGGVYRTYDPMDTIKLNTVNNKTQKVGGGDTRVLVNGVGE